MYRKILPKESLEALFQLVLPATHQETTLRGCHDKISHLDLERMLDVILDISFSLKWLYRQRNMFERCCQCVTFKVKQQRALMETTMATLPPKLVHIDGPLHPLCPSIYHLIPDGPDSGHGPLGQFHHLLQVTVENPFRQGEEF